MKTIKTWSILLVGALLVTASIGCSEEAPVVEETPKSPEQSQEQQSSASDTFNLTLEQVKEKSPFPLMLPSTLPHGMTFDTAATSNDPSTGKVSHVVLSYMSPDKKYILGVDQWEGTTIDLPDAKVLTEKLNGHEVKYAHSANGSVLVTSNGKVVCILSTPPKTDLATEQALLEIAKNFK